MCEWLKQAVLKIYSGVFRKQLIPKQKSCNPIFFNQLYSCSQVY